MPEFFGISGALPGIPEKELEDKSKILVIDDEELLLQATCRMLERSGYEVFRASVAGEAISVARDNQLDLVIADVVIPGSDGLELVDRIRDIQDVPVLIMSGFYGTDQLPRGLPAIGKPFQHQELLDAVQEAMA